MNMGASPNSNRKMAAATMTIYTKSNVNRSMALGPAQSPGNNFHIPGYGMRDRVPRIEFKKALSLKDVDISTESRVTHHSAVAQNTTAQCPKLGKSLPFKLAGNLPSGTVRGWLLIAGKRGSP